jgi:hypothetical protein
LVCKQQGWDRVHSLLGVCTHLSLFCFQFTTRFIYVLSFGKIMVIMASCARWLTWMSGNPNSKSIVHMSKLSEKILLL